MEGTPDTRVVYLPTNWMGMSDERVGESIAGCASDMSRRSASVEIWIETSVDGKL